MSRTIKAPTGTELQDQEFHLPEEMETVGYHREWSVVNNREVIVYLYDDFIELRGVFWSSGTPGRGLACV